LALNSARINPQDIDVISAHATSTGVGDIAETRALHSVFQEHVMHIPVYAAKSMTGHMLAASGAVETVALIEGLRHSIIPPTINLESPDEECDLDYVPHQARDVKSSIVLNNSFGFGGQNSVLVLRDVI
jgi:3-oxoacyl-[acyl-carrier-protein] synthase II